MPGPTNSGLATAQTYDTLREAAAKLNEALTMIGQAEQCGVDCQQWRALATQLGQRIEQRMGVLFPNGRRPAR